MSKRTLRGRSGRSPRQDLANFVETLPHPTTLLGLTHVTSAYTIRDVVETGSIVADDPCKVLCEPVTYSFYGRAAFRMSNPDEPTNLASLFPCVLILDPATVPKPKYVFGFDTGAFMGGMMDAYLHPQMPLFDFSLMPEVSSAAKLVNAIFASTSDYFRNNPTLSISPPSSNFEAGSYIEVVKHAAQCKLDDRASTPEIIFQDAVDVRTCVKAAVVPDSISSDPLIGGKLRSFGLKILDYPWSNGSRPAEYHFLVRNLVQDCYKSFGWVS